MKYDFPKGFYWGAAASAPQTEGMSLEGGKAATIWDYWYKTQPERFFQGVGPKNTSDFYMQYKEDIENMKKLNFNSYRTSISWARLLPDGKNVNDEAVEFYNNVIDEMIRNGVKPIMNLFHFDMPLIMQEKGGWENRQVVEDFAFYAKTAFKLFGDKVKMWTTFNEPIVPVEAGYLYNQHYPCVVDMKRAVQVAYNTMIASAKAVKEFKEDNNQGKIGIILNLTPSYARSENKEDLKAANIADLLFNRSFLDPSVKGEYPEELMALIRENNLIPEYKETDKELIRDNTVDFLGVNYYQPRRIKAKDKPLEQGEHLMPESFFDAYEWPERRMNPYRGWEIYEKGIYDIAINVKDNYYNIPWFISENGMGVQDEERFIDETGIVKDDYRIDFIKEHLKWLHRGIQEGSNCFGYHLWTFMDNWSWCNAYKNRYGLFRVDIYNNYKRTIKKSGLWYGNVIKNNGFED